MSTSFKPLTASEWSGGQQAAGHDARRGPVPVTGQGHQRGPAVQASSGASGLASGAEQAGMAEAALARLGTVRLADFQAARRTAVEEEAARADARVMAFQSVREPSAEEEAAREAGYSAGYAAGWAAATREEAEAIQARIQQRTELEFAAVARLEQMRSTLMMARETARSMASPVLQLHADEVTMAAITLAEDLVGLVLRDARTRVTAALTRALTAEEEAGIVCVRMNPEDAAHYRELVADPEFMMALPEGVELVADPSLQPGDAVTELENGFVDARLSSAMNRVHEEFATSETLAR